MDRPQILVAGILAVAVGFFALRFTSDEADPYAGSYGDSGDEYAMADRGDGSYELSGRGDRFGGDRFSGSRAPGSSSTGARISRFGPSSGGPGAPGSRGGVETATGGARDRGGRIGSSAGGRRGGLGDGVGRASGSSISSAVKDRSRSIGADGLGARDARVDMLTGKEAEIDPFYDENQLDDNPDDDVLLEVKNKEDVDRKAEVLEEVESSDDGEWLEVGEDAMLTFPDLGNANPNSGTISLDIVPNWNGADQTDNSLLQIREPHQWENRMQLVKNGQFLRFIVTDNTGHEADISFKIPDWVEGDAHRIQATWDEGVTTLYVDGKRVGSNTYPGQLQFKPTTPMHLGSDLASGGSYAGFNGKIGNVKVYDSAKSPNDV
jgi:hypothetical protein